MWPCSIAGLKDPSTCSVKIYCRKPFNAECAFLVKDEQREAEKTTVTSSFPIPHLKIFPGRTCVLPVHSIFLLGAQSHSPSVTLVHKSQ